MIIQDTRDKVLSLVDEKTVRRLRTSLDYVIKTEDNGILLSSRWIDNSPMLIYSTSSETHFWAKNKDIRELAKDADDSKGNELFGLLIAIATYDLAALNDLEPVGFVSTDMGYTYENLLVNDYANTQYIYKVEETDLKGYTTVYSHTPSGSDELTDGTVPAVEISASDDHLEMDITNTMITGKIEERLNLCCAFSQLSIPYNRLIDQMALGMKGRRHVPVL